MHGKYKVSMSYGSKVIVNVIVDNRQQSGQIDHLILHGFTVMYPTGFHVLQSSVKGILFYFHFVIDISFDRDITYFMYG